MERKDFLRRIFLIDLTGGLRLTTFTGDLSGCTFCGLCEDACPLGALELTQDFVLANCTRQGMIWDPRALDEGPRPTCPTRYARRLIRFRRTSLTR
jgi:formate hydrogenlyase subunit 6/NADH:ubiquinone oxidoreductase subunit I